MAETKPAAPFNPDNVKTLVGFLLVGFAGVLSFIGITSSEISTILRNDQAAALLVFFPLLAAIVAGLLAAVFRNGPRPQVGYLLAVFCFGAAGCVAVANLVRIPLIDLITFKYFWDGGTFEVWAFPILVLAGIGLILATVWPHLSGSATSAPSGDGGVAGSTDGGTATSTGSGAAASGAVVAATDAARTSLLRRMLSRLKHALQRVGNLIYLILHTQILDLNSLLIVIAMVLIGVSILAALRVESGVQDFANIQLLASDKTDSSNEDMTLTVTASRLTDQQFIVVSLSGSPRGSDSTPVCTESNLGDPTSCEVNCKDATVKCKIIANWVVRPDVTGAVKQTTSFAVSAQDYGRVLGSALLCQPPMTQTSSSSKKKATKTTKTSTTQTSTTQTTTKTPSKQKHGQKRATTPPPDCSKIIASHFDLEFPAPDPDTGTTTPTVPPMPWPMPHPHPRPTPWVG